MHDDNLYDKIILLIKLNFFLNCSYYRASNNYPNRYNNGAGIADRFQCADQFRCLNGKCVGYDLTCNGRNDCFDNSDESADICGSVPVEKPVEVLGLTCPSSADFRCNNGQCISNDQICDGRAHCRDNSDELVSLCTQNASGTTKPDTTQAPVLTCTGMNNFRCSNGQCISKQFICDGTPHCRDSSDELFSLCSKPSTACTGTNDFRCKNGQCISKQLICNGSSDCRDNSDELYALCSSTTACSGINDFRCNNNQCISKNQICDGNSECEDNSDELYSLCSKLTATSCSGINNFRCNNGQCITKNQTCDGISHCQDNSDELFSVCSTSITACTGINDYRCKNGQCIARNKLCDGISQCSDNSDELYALCSSTTTCSGVNDFRCNNGQCISKQLICDGTSQCKDNSDELYSVCSTIATAVCSGINDFRCNNGQCISKLQTCDGTSHCQDNSDELFSLCSKNTSNGPTLSTIACSQLTNFRCQNGQCILRNQLCDRISHCQDDSDELFSLCSKNSSKNTTSNSSSSLTITTPNRGPNKEEHKVCEVPKYPANGYYLLDKSQCSSGVNCQVPNNIVSLNPGTFLIYGCNDGYNINGDPNVLCAVTGKWVAPPTCESNKFNN